MSKPIVSVSSINNHAIATYYVDRGRNHGKALKLLQDALQQIIINISENPHNAPSASNVCHVPTIRYISITKTTTDVEEEREYEATSSSHSPLAMYLRPLEMISSCDGGNNMEHQWETTCVIYNMALISHSKGFHCGNTRALNKALNLYSMVLSLLRGDDTAMYPFDIKTLLVLAVWNNMGHIHSLLLNLEETYQCFDRIREILSFYKAGTLNKPDQGDTDIFHLNSIIANLKFQNAPSA